MKTYILAFVPCMFLVSCVTTTTTETKPDGTVTTTKTTVADPAIIGKAIDAGVVAAEIIAQKKDQEVDSQSGK